MRKTRPYCLRADEAVKCCRVCRDEAFLADEVIHYSKQRYGKYRALGVILVVMPWNYPIIGWRSGSLLPGSVAGNVGLLEHALNRPHSALKSRRSCYGLGYGGSRRGRYRWHRRKRFYRGGGGCR